MSKTIMDNPFIIEIDEKSGFCFGVTTAINKAEEELTKDNTIYCLGDIVHNDKECDRLRQMGLRTINKEDFSNLYDTKVMFRAHGEPPSSYNTAKDNNINIIDATCPVVLGLQRRIKDIYQQMPNCQIVIFGKQGHAEVMGLVGQTEGKAIVIENLEEAKMLDMQRDIRLFSQTTQSLTDFQEIVEYIRKNISKSATFEYYDTICRQVANRLPNLLSFAVKHDAILFVSGKKSSNGKNLYNACKSVNPKTYMIEGPDEINHEWFKGISSLGICGATSTPKWLMEECKKAAQNQ